MPNIPHFHPKTLSLLIIGVLLSACQSIPTAHTDNSTVPANTARLNQAFLPSATAQRDVLTALRQHMGSERYAVSTHHYAVKPLTISEIDKGSDAAFTTMLKVMDFKDRARRSERSGFISLTDYLGAAGELDGMPYLRYGDEGDESKNMETVTRKVGTSEAYQDVSRQIDNLLLQFRSHAEELGVGLLTRAFTQDEANFDRKAVEAYMNQTHTDLQKQANELLADAQGYQKQDIMVFQTCATNHHNAFLAIIKNIKNSDDVIVYAEALSLWSHYASNCANIIDNGHILEPYDYIRVGYSKQYLDGVLAINQCHIEFNAKMSEFIKAGKDPIKDKDEFDEASSAYQSCTDESLQKRADNYDSTESDVYAGKMGFIRAYMDMKKEEAKTGKTEPPSDGYGMMSLFGRMLNSDRTPEQVTAQNLYQYQHLSVSSLSHHEPNAKRSQVLWSVDYDSPTASYSMQLPVRADFAQGELVADVSAFLPLVALISPEHAPLPKDIPDGLMSFKLPDELQKQIPTDVIYEAIHQGVIHGMEGLNSEKFTPVDISQDAFAKEVGANRAVKVEFGVKEVGKVYAVIAKHVGRDLKAYVDQHPERYSDKSADITDSTDGQMQGNKIKTLIDNFTMINSSYRTDDVGGLMGAIEGLLPFALNATSYVYLNGQGDIIAVQTLGEVDEYVGGMTTQSLNQIRYDKRLFDKHALAGQFKEVFAKTAAVDGVALFKKAKEQSYLESEARYARYEYDYAYDYDYTHDECGCCTTEANEQAAIAAAQTAAQAATEAAK